MDGNKVRSQQLNFINLIGCKAARARFRRQTQVAGQPCVEMGGGSTGVNCQATAMEHVTAKVREVCIERPPPSCAACTATNDSETTIWSA